MSSWLNACKEYAASVGKWCVPKKGSPEYEAIKKIQDRMGVDAAAPPKVTSPVPETPKKVKAAKVAKATEAAEATEAAKPLVVKVKKPRVPKVVPQKEEPLIVEVVQVSVEDTKKIKADQANQKFLEEQISKEKVIKKRKELKIASPITERKVDIKKQEQPATVVKSSKKTKDQKIRLDVEEKIITFA